MNPKWVLLAVLTGVMWGQAPPETNPNTPTLWNSSGIDSTFTVNSSFLSHPVVEIAGADNVIRINDANGKLMVKVANDGKVTYGEGYNADDGAKAFWAAMYKYKVLSCGEPGVDFNGSDEGWVVPKAAESRTKEHAAPKGSSGQIPYTFERAPECGDGAKMLPFNPCAAADKANADYGPGMSGLVGCMPVSEGVGIHSESTVVTPTGSRAKAEPIDVPAVRERPLSKLYPEVLDKNQFYYYGDPRWTCKDPTRALLVSQDGKYAQCHKVKP